MHTYKHPRPALTVDVAAFRRNPDTKVREVLLIQRGKDPFKGAWALPGGHVEENETVEHAARREAREETGLEVGVLKSIGTYDAPGRDPRGWYITIAFTTWVEDVTLIVAGDDAAEARWFPVRELPPLAFDHAEMITAARTHWMEELHGPE